jgi:ABC-type Mn2+/Zn2+ transport system permease subunit
MKGFALTIDATALSILLIVLHGCLTFLVLFKKSFSLTYLDKELLETLYMDATLLKL